MFKPTAYPSGLQILLLALLFGGAAFAIFAFRKEIPAKPNFLLITIDTLRRDHLGCYGSDTARTPNIDAIARKGIVFDHFYSTTNVTLASHLSMLSGTYLSKHGLYGNSKYLVPQTIPLLPSLLRKGGYRSYGIAAFTFFRKDWLEGYGQQFDFFSSPKKDLVAEEVTHQFVSILPDLKRQSSFVWLHFFDPHVPYRPPNRFRKHSIQAKKTGLVPLPEFDSFQFWTHWLKPDGVRTVNEARALYAEEVSYTDEQIGKIWDLLSQHSLLENTVVLIAADHGEMLGERNAYFNHHTLYDQTIHVPLLIYSPSFHHRRVDELVSAIDLAPTVLDLAGLSAPNSFQGKSLYPFLQGKDITLHDFVYAEHAGNLGQAVISNRYKLIDSSENGIENPRLFDLEADTLERTNLYRQLPRQAKILEKMKIPAGNDPNRKIALTEEERQILLSVGYVQ